jgi:non-specific serine/threonine protein kinase
MDLVGREVELAEIHDRLAGGRRLVTIVGPGGVGKTALARVALARYAATTAAPGVVELARVERGDAVAGELAAQLGYPSFEALTASAEQAGVVLVDNCEHVLDPTAEAIAHLLERRPGLAVVATSRSPLSLPGESIVALAPLAVPPDGVVDRTCGAMRLFEERARDAGVALDERDLELASVLCRRLDGVPLAIELAAARLRSMSLGELDSLLSNSIDTLSGPRHRGTAHQRSVRETIQWSLGLLSDGDRDAFGWLGLCPGWFEAALVAALTERRADEVAPLIDRLVDASMLVVDHRSTPTRYRMLEPIRAVAIEALTAHGERTTGLERLADHLVAQVLVRVEQSRTSMGAEAVATAIDRFDQIDLALRHCLATDDDPRRARVLYAILWGIVQQARLDEVLSLGEQLLARWPDVAGPHGADAASVLATARLFNGNLDGARSLARAALAHEQDSVFAAVTLRRAIGHAARFEGDHAEAAAWFAAAAAAGFERNVPTLATGSLAFQAQDIAAQGNVDDALALVRGAARGADELGSALTLVLARAVEASILAAGGSSQRALGAELARANLAAAEAGNYTVALLASLQTLTACALGAGDIGTAAAFASRLVDASTRGGPGDLRRALELAAAVLAAAGDDAARHLVVTAAALPDTSPMTRAVAVPSLGTGRLLDRSEAQRLASERLAAVEPELPADAGPEPVASGIGQAAFTRAGDVWHISYAGITAAVATSKGMEDLVVLLAQPGREVHCVELAGAVVEQADTGEVIDASARRQYEDRVRELQAEIDEAEANNDHARAERAQTEFDTIVDHLTAALGLSGKTRKTGGSAERARSAVTHRVRAALRRIARAHPQAGRHLERSVTTGTYCRYEPEQPVEWTL